MHASQILKLASNITSMLATQLAPDKAASAGPAASDPVLCAVCEQSDGMFVLVAGEVICGGCIAQIRRDNQGLRKQIAELTRASEELARASEELARSSRESESVPRVPNGCMVEVVRDKRIACLCVPKTDVDGVVAFALARYPDACIYVDGSIRVATDLLPRANGRRRPGRARGRKE